MFGIRKGTSILCHVRFINGEPGYQFVPEDFVQHPVLKESAIEIDNLMQKLQVEENDYTLVVFELDEEQSMIYVYNKLKGI